MELNPLEHQRIMDIIRSDPDEKTLGETMKQLLDNPLFNRFQVFANQSIRILDNAALRYLYVSESVFELTGYTREEVMKGGLWFTYRKIHPMDVLSFGLIFPKINSALKSLTAEDKLAARFTFDVRIKCKDGRYKNILQNCSVLSLSPSGKPYILFFASTDITAYKKGTSMNYNLSVQRAGKGMVTLLTGSMKGENVPLTPRELEILQLIADGNSEKGISDKLFLSPQTVKTHRKNMLQKTDAKNSVDLVRMGIANGWI
jgi:DNA-binding CsgD family transcriptional regulator